MAHLPPKTAERCRTLGDGVAPVFRQPFWTASLTIADYTLRWIVGPGSFPVPDPLCRLETFAFPDWRDTPEARPDVSGIEIRGRKPFSFNLVAPMRI
jgi:hypothetical protein